MKRFIPISLILSFCLLITGCVYTPVKGRNESARIDRRYLEYWYDSQLLPAFELYELQADSLYSTLQAATPSTASHEAIKARFKSALTALQGVILFDRPIFANNYYSLSALAASFPVNKSALESLANQSLDADGIEEGLSLGTVSPNSLGYAALDILLYGSPTSRWQQHLPFMRTVGELLLKQARTATTYYKQHRETFLSNDGFGIHGSLSQLMNTLLQNWEVSVRTAKVGYPIGIYGIIRHEPSPLTAEAYYSRLSVELLREAVAAFNRFFEGVPTRRNFPNNAESSFRNMLHEYLPPPANQEIPQKVAKELAELDTQLAAIDSDIPNQLESPKGLQRLQSVHASLQRIVGLLKTNAVNALGMTITYSDGEEGD